jgi:hypothetical protein
MPDPVILMYKDWDSFAIRRNTLLDGIDSLSVRNIYR